MQISLTYESIIKYLQIGFDIFFVWILINYLIKVVRNNQKTVQIFQGIALVIVIRVIAKYLGLSTVEMLTDNIVSWGFLAIIIVFQPEIRSILERLGKSNALARIATLTSSEKEKLIDELMKATASLSKSKTGALITLEQSNPLNDYVTTGVKMNSLVSAELLCSIFMTTTPLHDGAVIIQGDKMACASAYFPPTSRELPSKYGARHRAAIGISEVTDGFTIVVSEESGRVSVAQTGQIVTVNDTILREMLEKIILNKEFDQSKKTFIKAAEIDEDFTKEQVVESDMKVFGTTSFTIDDANANNTSELVQEIIANAVNENTIDPDIAIKTVNVAKDTIEREQKEEDR